MTDFLGNLHEGLSGFGRVPDAQSFVNPLPNSTVGVRTISQPSFGQAVATEDNSRLTPPVVWGAAIDPGPQFYWFERMHSYPNYFELGNILTTLTRDLEIYNAFREESKQITDFTNNADVGVSLIGFPSLPVTLAINSGLQFQVQISTSGPPELDGTLDFTTDVGLLVIPITGSRVVMFPWEPESPIKEVLQFKTDILQGVNGAEQRVSVRKHPRQLIQMKVLLEEGHQRRKLQALLSTWQPRVFGLPIWFEARRLSSAAQTGDTTIQVDTMYGDFRVGSLAIVRQDEDTFDALEIASIEYDSLTFSSPLTHDYETSALVMPLRVAITSSQLGRALYAVNLAEHDLRFTTIDNESDIASVAAFNTHNSKVMLDDYNLMAGSTIDDSLMRQIERVDNEVGSPTQFSDWDDSMPMTSKGFIANTPRAVWEARQLVHALRGSQVSFYLPTFYRDLVVKQTLTNGSALMDIENIGYTDYMNGREPNKSVWIELVDGTILTRQITDADVVDDDTERLTVDTVWPYNIAPEDISRVSFLRLVRIADDQVEFDHDYAGDAKVRMAVIGVVR